MTDKTIDQRVEELKDFLSYNSYYDVPNSVFTEAVHIIDILMEDRDEE